MYVLTNKSIGIFQILLNCTSRIFFSPWFFYTAQKFPVNLTHPVYKPVRALSDFNLARFLSSFIRSPSTFADPR